MRQKRRPRVEQLILAAMAQGRGWTAYALADQLAYSTTSIYRALTALEREGLIRYDGPQPRGGYWRRWE